jgi:molybdopterin/thiamine biosynthesis adenylyltransferase
MTDKSLTYNSNRSESEMVDILYNELFSRNIGVFSESEQEKLQHAKIAIAGVGGVGGLLAERLLRLGIGRLKITDPGIFKKSSLNRQFGSSMLNLDQNKAEVIYTQLKDINPMACIEYDNTGIQTEDHANLIVADCDLIIDEMDFGMFRHSIWLQRAARQANIHYLFAYGIGFGALAVIFDPKGMTLEEYDNLPSGDGNPQEEIKVPLERVLPIIPSYSPIATHDGLKKIDIDGMSLPSLSIGVGLASILAANEAVNIILRRREIAVAPSYTYIDLLDRKFVVGKIS